MSDVLRVYLPDECNDAGIPLDWLRCRACQGVAVILNMDGGNHSLCEACGGHGSLKAAALDHLRKPAFVIDRYGPTWEMGADGEMHQTFPGWKVSAEDQASKRIEARCQDCGHPMSDGTWEREGSDIVPYGGAQLQAISEGLWLKAMREQERDVCYQPVHYSPCDEGCTHYDGVNGPVTDDAPTATVRPAPQGTDSDVQIGALLGEGYGPFEASWRQVDVRLTSWPHDLRPEHLLLLCLRCWAKR